jgi:hypothetical protein
MCGFKISKSHWISALKVMGQAEKIIYGNCFFSNTKNLLSFDGGSGMYSLQF